MQPKSSANGITPYTAKKHQATVSVYYFSIFRYVDVTGTYAAAAVAPAVVLVVVFVNLFGLHLVLMHVCLVCDLKWIKLMIEFLVRC